MYKNRTSRTKVVPTIDRHPQFFIRRSEIAFDGRARYVEFVCGVWNEGRFGPDLVAPVVIDLSSRPELEPTAFCDLPDDEPNALIPRDAFSSQGRAGNKVLEAAFRRAKHLGLLHAKAIGNNITADSSSNQGRGSP